jgi:methionine-rich copper-binding protein CopC
MQGTFIPLLQRTAIFCSVFFLIFFLWVPHLYAATIVTNIGETNDKSTTSVRSNVWKAWKFSAGGPATITSVTLAVDLVQSVTGLDIKFYNDNAGNLGSQIGGYLDYTSTDVGASQATYGTLVGSDIVIPSAGSYWIGLVPPSSANIYVKLTSSTNETGDDGWEMFLGANGFVSFYSGQFYNNTATIGTLMLTMSGDTNDETAPTVSTLSPADGATTATTTANLVMTFDEAVDAETGNITIKKASDNSTVETISVTSGQVTGSGTATITINPSSNLLESTAYYVQIDATAFDDAAGNSYAGISDTTSWNFTTADETNPSVLSFSPTDGSTSVGVTDNLVINFSEAVDAETGNITIKKASDNSTVETISVTSGQVTGSGTATITINPTTDFTTDTSYYVYIDATAFDDASGRSYAGINDTTTWNFSVAAASGGTSRLQSTPPSPRIDVNLKDMTTAVVMGSLLDKNVRVTETGFEYWHSKRDIQKVILSGTPQSYRYTLRDLKCGAEYSLRGYTKNITGITYTDIVKFETDACGVEDVSEDEEEVSHDDEKDDEGGIASFVTPSIILGDYQNELYETRDLTLGSEGEDVKALQLFLIEEATGPAARELARIGVTGYFGMYTQNALGEFQKAHSILPHRGYYGPITRAFIQINRESTFNF